MNKDVIAGAVITAAAILLASVLLGLVLANIPHLGLVSRQDVGRYHGSEP